MNEALVNASNGFLPSWDIGGAAEWDIGRFGVRGVYMNVGENDDGNNYNFYGAQVMVTLETALGEGHYRVNYNFTSKAFLDPDGTSKERQDVLIFSFDQELGGSRGLIRFGLRFRQCPGRLQGLYTGGINISGKWWGREQDNIGIGYGYLESRTDRREHRLYPGGGGVRALRPE